MSKLKKKELLRLLDAMHQWCVTENWDDKTEQAYQQIKELIQKPGVTEEWIQKAIDYIAGHPSYKRLEKKLKEAGVEIVKK